MASNIVVFPPDSVASPLTPANVPYPGLMGKWHVVASTLPLWKGKKNVTITYTALEEGHTTFDDLVEYHSSLSVDPKSSKSTIRGIDRLDVHPLASGESAASSGARFAWRGRGWLRIASSRWQLLGYHIRGAAAVDQTSDEEAPEWVVTFFSKTLFTPAGLDVYARSGTSLQQEARIAIVEAIRAIDDKAIADLSQNFFDIPHDE